MLESGKFKMALEFEYQLHRPASDFIISDDEDEDNDKDDEGYEVIRDSPTPKA